MSPSPFEQADAWEVQTERILPDGNHIVTIEEANNGRSRNQHPQIELKLANPEGSIRDWLVITESTVGKVVQLAQAAGVDVPGEDDIQQGLQLKDEWVFRLSGKTVGVVVREEPDNRPDHYGESRPRVQGYVEPARIKPSDVTHPAAARQFANASGPQPGNRDIPF
jgi:hypothetical protein